MLGGVVESPSEGDGARAGLHLARDAGRLVQGRTVNGLAVTAAVRFVWKGS